MSPSEFRALADVLPEPLLLVSGSGTIVAHNRPAGALLGIGAADLPAPLTPMLTADADRVSAYLRACSRSRAMLPGSLPLRRADGTATPCRCHGAVVRPANGNSQALLVLRLDPGAAAPSRFALLGRKVDALTREVRIRRGVEQERADLLATERQLREELEQQTVELEQQTEEAQQLSEELEVANQELTSALAAAENAWHVADRANRAKAEFLATMSHELRTPIHATLGYLELLIMGLRGPVTVEQLADLDRVVHNQRHLLSVINNILEFSRVDAGRVSFERGPVSLHQVIAAVIPMIESLASVRSVRLRVTACDPAMIVTADAGKVQQILVNLLSNAAKFSPSGTTIHVGCDGDDRLARVRVRDEGPGIPADKHELIFHPFVQLDASLTRQAEGTGLGLTISRAFARGMGGDLTVESAPGEGATFILTLPCMAAG